jgi:hypothetical protein
VNFFAWNFGTSCVEFLSVFNGESNHGTTANQVPVQFEQLTHRLTMAAQIEIGRLETAATIRTARGRASLGVGISIRAFLVSFCAAATCARFVRILRRESNRG